MTDQIKCPKCGSDRVSDFPAVEEDDPMYSCDACGEWFNEVDACTCPAQCGSTCKGTCGCKKCHDDYNDFLSVE